ncbi:quinolinate synthase NadA [Quadrisphaera setariae]|uniref:Quinolinate synthase n=1 Tax=Quadrisphaera setariae TaxID=2593304 RepID=A0A5C8ZHW7_9ACTN|nr:quinolinate synthase NadA [Quadrisphaera setariae]TXR57482.1 quinolinate synthase NadA [Quadrisphaera setariae]
MVSVAVTLGRSAPAGAPGASSASVSSCDARLAGEPFALDAMPGLPAPAPEYGPGASVVDTAPAHTPVQQQIPERYRRMQADEVHARVRAAKAELGSSVVVLGHHYQRDEVIEHADVTGDSFLLARRSLERPEAKYVVFCGVHFMAETADLLTRLDQAVVLPNLAAGCSMADMADLDSVQDCWDQLEAAIGRPLDVPGEDGLVEVVPVTYMNSSAAIKAFCGEHGGIVCTSSNATAVLTWAFARGRRVLFVPDQHLGRNTAKAMGVPADLMPLWDPRKPMGGNSVQALVDSRVLLWRGWCSVHQRFTTAQIDAARAADPSVQVVVHPECPQAVVDAADQAGSTEFIIKAVEAAPAGSSLAIGTEINLVRRLADAHPDKTITCLDPVICPCSTMYRIHPGYLAWVLESLAERERGRSAGIPEAELGPVVNRVVVDDESAAHARTALERMLAVVP